MSRFKINIMEATELRKKKTELENEIKQLVSKFIIEVGHCEVYVDITNRTWQSSAGTIENEPPIVRVKVEV